MEKNTQFFLINHNHVKSQILSLYSSSKLKQKKSFEKELVVVTVPSVEHVVDEEVVEADLRFGNGTSHTVELGHHHRQTQRFLLVSLKIKLDYLQNN